MGSMEHNGSSGTPSASHGTIAESRECLPHSISSEVVLPEWSVEVAVLQPSSRESIDENPSASGRQATARGGDARDAHRNGSGRLPASERQANACGSSIDHAASGRQVLASGPTPNPSPSGHQVPARGHPVPSDRALFARCDCCNLFHDADAPHTCPTVACETHDRGGSARAPTSQRGVPADKQRVSFQFRSESNRGRDSDSSSSAPSAGPLPCNLDPPPGISRRSEYELLSRARSHVKSHGKSDTLSSAGNESFNEPLGSTPERDGNLPLDESNGRAARGRDRYPSDDPDSSLTPLPRPVAVVAGVGGEGMTMIQMGTLFPLPIAGGVKVVRGSPPKQRR